MAGLGGRERGPNGLLVNDGSGGFSVAADPQGIDVTVTPRRLTLEPGQTKAFTVRIARDTAAPNNYYGGRLTWTDGRHTVRTPIVVRLTRPADTGWRASVTVLFAIVASSNSRAACSRRGNPHRG